MPGLLTDQSSPLVTKQIKRTTEFTLSRKSLIGLLKASLPHDLDVQAMPESGLVSLKAAEGGGHVTLTYDSMRYE